MKASVTIFLLLSLFNLSTSIFRKHFYVQKGMTWTEAQIHCEENHDDLSIASYSELTVLSQNPAITFGFYWIGLYRDSQSPSVWRWTGGEEATDVPWHTGQPDTLHEQCVTISKSSSTAYDTACFVPIPFFCMESFKLILVQRRYTWDEALQYCRHNNMDLGHLISDAAMREAQNKSAPALTRAVWMGLRFILGQWLWVDGETVEYEAWSGEGELQCPSLDQRCGALDLKKMVWEPANCDQRLNFLCVKRIYGTSEENDD